MDERFLSDETAPRPDTAPAPEGPLSFLRARPREPRPQAKSQACERQVKASRPSGA